MPNWEQREAMERWRRRRARERGFGWQVSITIIKTVFVLAVLYAVMVVWLGSGK